MNQVASRPPGRAVLRLAGILTQLICASALLLGTIAFVLVQQNKSGGVEYVIGWAGAALVGLVFGGLMGRGGMISLLGSALLDAAFGIVLLVLDHAVLKGLVRVLPASDVEMIAGVLVGAGIGMVSVAALCLLSIPQALRYAKWLREEVEEVERASAQMQAQPPPPLAPRMTYTVSSQHSGLGGRHPAHDPAHIAASSTARGWAPQVPTGRITVWNMPAATPEESRSRRRLYFALAGFAIGVGGGIGVLVSSSARKSGPPPASVVVATVDAATPEPVAAPDANVIVSGSTIADGPVADGGAAENRKLAPAIQTLIEAQRGAIAKGDLAALVETLAPTAIGFGVDADEFAEGRDAIAAQVKRDLGEPPAKGFRAAVTFSNVGEASHHAWIALELEIDAPGESSRRFAITELAAAIDGKWTVVAWHWATPVADSTAKRLTILGTIPKPVTVPNVTTAIPEVDTAVRSSFSSRAAHAAARSTRDDAFNFGSGPKERVKGGEAIKRVFSRLKATISLRDGARIVSGDIWDPAQKGAPTMAYAMANVDFQTKTDAGTDLIQTFRVSMVLLKEETEWKIVQTQWSHGGPIR